MNLEHQNPLIAACATPGNVALVKSLLSSGVSVSLTVSTYGDALGAAASSGAEDLVTLLLENGAEANAKSPSGDIEVHSWLQPAMTIWVLSVI